MHPLQKSVDEIKELDKDPFKNLKISDTSILDTVDERSLCKKCNKSRKYFCYVCYIPVPHLEGKIPKVSLPIKIDIIKHKNEIDGKSTSAHAAILAPDDVRVFTYPTVPEYSANDNVVLIYPSSKAKTIKECFEENYELLKTNEFPFTRAVFIDSTWNQSKGIFKDERINTLPAIVLKNKISQFWRHQKKSPRWYLATIEAIHELLIEMVNERCDMIKRKESETHVDNRTSSGYSYNGQYDNLLFFFNYMYSKIHDLYDHDSLLSYKRSLE
ncbi:conserved hypothetical protein [Pediculus humanus corporis]|uniref:tRNA-uridine aminocarboxypropyltransferase 1 n=1 Tax=Pediculus humanus subsp. corporis TaxID=121224 RepID=E0VPR2_PEDHC|nr:uncharacterized protein Phum_PHUM363290 [Pediculus humanus corporis]EEB15368.1 conserved hypothetical protein [Pediculus humanus corporis]